MSILTTLKSFFAPTVSTDDTLTKVDEVLPLPDGSTNEARYLLVKLTPWSESEELNAKARRRVKRIVSRLVESYPGLDLSEPIIDDAPPANARDVLADLDAKDACQRFSAARSAAEVERVLNSLIGPTTESKSSLDWQELKEVLFTVLSNRNITNKNIRRRISRLIFVIANESDLQRLSEFKKEAQEPVTAVSQAKAMRPPPAPRSVSGTAAPLKPSPAAMQISNRPSGSSTSKPTVAVEESTPLVIKSISDCLSELRSAEGATGIETAISNVSASSQGSAAAKQELKSTLERLSEDANMVSNTKVKRKVQRLIKTLETIIAESAQSSAAAPTQAPTTSQGNKPQHPPSSTPASAGAGIEGVVHKLKGVHSAEQLDAVLVALDMRTVLPAGEGATEGPEPATAQQRRLLKRSIEQVLSQEDVSSTMNAKVRRRVSRITSALAADGGEGAQADAAVPKGEATSTSTSQHSDPSARATGMGLSIPSTGHVVNETVKKIPYVVFVGNLSYDTTAADLETHLRQTAELEGPIEVRLRTNPETQQSTGVAFVDLEGARELHQCVAAAHHSSLHGRIINVEKSCGGRNKAQRGDKIASKRTEQKARLEEAINRVLVQYEQRGVLQGVHKWGATLKESMYAHSPAHLSQVCPITVTAPSSRVTD